MLMIQTKLGSITLKKPKRLKIKIKKKAIKIDTKITNKLKK